MFETTSRLTIAYFGKGAVVIWSELSGRITEAGERVRPPKLGATRTTKQPAHTYIRLHSNTRPRNNTVGTAATLEKIVLSRLVPHIPDKETKPKTQQIKRSKNNFPLIEYSSMCGPFIQLPIPRWPNFANVNRRIQFATQSFGIPMYLQASRIQK